MFSSSQNSCTAVSNLPLPLPYEKPGSTTQTARKSTMKIMCRAYRIRNILLEHYSVFYDKRIYSVLYLLPCAPSNTVNTAYIPIIVAHSPFW